MIDSECADPSDGWILSQEDENVLRQKARDINDIDSITLERAQAGFRRAYEVAQRISNGTLDPLSV